MYEDDEENNQNDDWDDGIDFADVTEGSVATNETSYLSMKDSILCLIDCNESMFAADADGEIPFRNVLRAVIQTYRNKILTSDSDLIGVCFYGTKEKDNPSDLPNIMLFSDLDTPDADKIMRLEQLLQSQFEQKFGHAEKEVPLGDALWTCSTIFGNCTVKVGTKRVFLFTNNDDPNHGSDLLQSQAKQRAQDLAQLGIQIELFPLNKASSPFIGSKFYSSIIDVGLDGDLEHLDGTSKLQELLDRARSKEVKKRSVGRISIMIGNDIEIGVKIFNLVISATKSSPIYIEKTSKAPVRVITKRICEDTGALLLNSQIKQAFQFGGTKVMFEKHEIKEIKTLDSPSIRIVGFKPRSALKDYHNLKHSSFLFPDEASIRGSSIAYAALLKKMLEMSKIAIAKMTARSNASVRLVALLPAKEIVKDGIQITPSGLYVIYLPFADDLRTIKSEPVHRATKLQVAAGVNLIKRLRLEDFDCRNFDNPSLQHHYITLESIALDKDPKDVQFPSDTVEPDIEGMKCQEQTLIAFKDSVFPFNYSAPNPSTTPGKKSSSSASRKRTRSDDDDVLNSPAAKRMKVSEEIDWQAEVSSGNIKKRNLEELKGYCNAHGIKGYSKWKKADMLDAVVEHITKSGGK